MTRLRQRSMSAKAGIASVIPHSWLAHGLFHDGHGRGKKSFQFCLQRPGSAVTSNFSARLSDQDRKWLRPTEGPRPATMPQLPPNQYLLSLKVPGYRPCVAYVTRLLPRFGTLRVLPLCLMSRSAAHGRCTGDDKVASMICQCVSATQVLINKMMVLGEDRHLNTSAG